MRILTFTLCLLLPLFVASQTSKLDLINTFLDEWHMNASLADMDSYFEKIDQEGVFIGTDATEVWSKQEFHEWSRPYFEEGKAWSFRASKRNIYLSGKNYAWFDELLTSSSGELRGSGVLIRINGEWKIMHYVLSVPVPNSTFKQVMEIINGSE
jgi:hypothetical protein